MNDRSTLNKRLFIILQIAIVLITFAGSVYVAVTPANSMMNWYNIDDAFYYYKVAQNVLSGHGFTFDQINLSNGFHPLWMVVCLGVFWLSEYNILLPLRVLILVSGFFNAATALLLFRFLKRYIHPSAALIGALTLGLYPVIYDTVVAHGMESAISMFFIVLLFSQASNFIDQNEGKPIPFLGMLWLGLIGALTILARLDNLFVVGIVGIFLLFKIKKIPTLVIFDILAVSISVFIAWIVRLGSDGVVLNTYSVYPMLVVSVIIKPIFLFFSGNYTSTKPINAKTVILRVILSLTAAFIFEYIVLFVLFKFNVTRMFSNSIMVIDGAIGFVLVLMVHLFLSRSVTMIDKNPFRILGNWIRLQWKPTLWGGVAYGSPIALLVGGYMLYNKMVFETFTPVSGQIKHWWSTLANTVYGRPGNLVSVLGLSTGSNKGPWSLITSKLYQTASTIAGWIKINNTDIIFGILIIITAVLFLLLLKSSHSRLIGKFYQLLLPAFLLGSLMHITYYNATGYIHTRSWYWLTEMLTLVVIGSLVLDWLFYCVDKIKFKIKLSPLPALVIVVIIFLGHFKYIRAIAPYSVPEELKADYLAEIRELEFYTTSGSRIGMTGGGMVAYFVQDRTIINLDGLINSTEYFNAMKAGTATQFLDRMSMDYVFGKPYMLQKSDPYDDILKDRLDEIGYIRGEDGFTLFRYLINQ